MSRESFDGEQAPVRKAFSDFRKVQEQEMLHMQTEGNRAKEAFVDLCNQAAKFPRPRMDWRRAGDGGGNGNHTGRKGGQRVTEEGADEEDMMERHIARLMGKQPAGERALKFPRANPRGTVEVRRFVKLFSDKQAVVNRGTDMDRCRWTGTSTGLDLDLREWPVARRILAQSMQHDEGRAERDSMRIVLHDVFKGWTAAELKPAFVLNDAFVFQPATIHAVGPINEWRFLPGKQDKGAFLLTKVHEKGAGAAQQWLGVGMGYVAPVNSVNAEFVPFRAAVGLNVFELHPHNGRYRTTLKLQAVFTPAQLGSVQVDWGHITQYTPAPSRAITFRMPVDSGGERFAYGSVFSRDGEPFNWSQDDGTLGGGVLQYEAGHTIQSKMQAMLKRLPMVELAAKIFMFKVPADIRAGLFRMYARTGRGAGRGDEWPVLASMPSVGPFLMQQIKLMYHAHLLKLSVYVLTMDCMRLSGVFGAQAQRGHREHDPKSVFAQALYVLTVNDKDDKAGGGIGFEDSMRKHWGRMVQSVMHMWHTALGTFPFGGSNQKFCTAEDYYKTVFGLESLLDALVKLHYLLAHEHGHQYARPKATITQISDAIREEVDRRVCGDEEKVKFIRAKVVGEMKVGKPQFNEGKGRRRDPLDFLGIHDLVCTDATGDIRSARLQLPVSLKSVSVRFDLGRTMGRLLPYWGGLQAKYLPSGLCFGLSEEDLRPFHAERPAAKGGRDWTTNDCCATGECSDPLHALNDALHRHAHAGLRQLMIQHHRAQSAERQLQEEGGDMFMAGGEGRDEEEGTLSQKFAAERSSFLQEATSMREFNLAFLSGGQLAVDDDDKADEQPKGAVAGRGIVELPLSVSGKVLKCVVNASFAQAPPSFSAATASYRPPTAPPALESGSSKQLSRMVELLSRMATEQGIIPPRAAR